MSETIYEKRKAASEKLFSGLSWFYFWFSEAGFTTNTILFLEKE